jgi:hypothetical protein
MVRGLDAALPRWDWHEVHERTIAAPPEEALRAFADAPFASDRVVELSLRLRGLRAAGTVREGLERLGFEVLVDTSTELVLGATGAPWMLRGGLRRFTAEREKTVRIACDLRAELLTGGGSLVSTETRILAVDAHAKRWFGRYWLVVRPFSGLIRRRWLRAAAIHAAARAR